MGRGQGCSGCRRKSASINGDRLEPIEGGSLDGEEGCPPGEPDEEQRQEQHYAPATLDLAPQHHPSR